MISILRKTHGFSLILWAMTLCFVSDIAVITLDPPGPVRPVFSYLTKQTSEGEEIQFPVHRRFLVWAENEIESRQNVGSLQAIAVIIPHLDWLVFHKVPDRTSTSVVIANAGPPAWVPIPLRC